MPRYDLGSHLAAWRIVFFHQQHRPGRKQQFGAFRQQRKFRDAFDAQVGAQRVGRQRLGKRQAFRNVSQFFY